VEARLQPRTGGVPAADAQAAQVLAAGGPRGQRLRRQERVLLLRADQRVRGRDRGLQRADGVLTPPAGMGRVVSCTTRPTPDRPPPAVPASPPAAGSTAAAPARAQPRTPRTRPTARGFPTMRRRATRPAGTPP